MMDIAPLSPRLAGAEFEAVCRDLEAYETDPWAVEAIFDAELFTQTICDAGCGTGIIGNIAQRRGHAVYSIDIRDWSGEFPEARRPDYVGDFLTMKASLFGDVSESTICMNPPFSLACQFVDRARDLGFRKIACFQRWAWRESGGRRQWWRDNPPARVWLCGERATCWRFDIAKECLGGDLCGAGKGRGATRCRECMGGSSTAHGWFIWERGHQGSVIHDLWRPAP